MRIRVAVMGVCAVGALLAGCASAGSAETSATPEPAGSVVVVDPSVESGATDDFGMGDLYENVTLGTLVPGAAGTASIPVTVNNPDTYTAEFEVEVAASSADSMTDYATGKVVLPNVAPGQSAQGTIVFVNEVPADAVARITSVSQSSVG